MNAEAYNPVNFAEQTSYSGVMPTVFCAVGYIFPGEYREYE